MKSLSIKIFYFNMNFISFNSFATNLLPLNAHLYFNNIFIKIHSFPKIESLSSFIENDYFLVLYFNSCIIGINLIL